MVKFMAYEENYFDTYKALGCKTVIYGAGLYAKRAFPYLKNVSYICDRRAGEIKELNGTAVILPGQLEMLGEMLLIVICIKSESIRKEIKDQLRMLSIDACVFDYFDNAAFSLFKEKKIRDCGERKEIQYVHLICEDRGWILRKFAVRMKEELEKQGYGCTIGNVIEPSADVNHHVSYASCEAVVSDYNETFMITHIDSYNKAEF